MRYICPDCDEEIASPDTHECKNWERGIGKSDLKAPVMNSDTLQKIAEAYNKAPEIRSLPAASMVTVTNLSAPALTITHQEPCSLCPGYKEQIAYLSEQLLQLQQRMQNHQNQQSMHYGQYRQSLQNQQNQQSQGMGGASSYIGFTTGVAAAGSVLTFFPSTNCFKG